MKSSGLKISFKKFLRNIKSQSAIEYSLLLVVVAALVLSLFSNNFEKIRNLFEGTTDSLINRTLDLD